MYAVSNSNVVSARYGITNERTFHRAPSENSRRGWKNRVALISYVLQVLNFSFANIRSNLSRGYESDYDESNKRIELPVCN